MQPFLKQVNTNKRSRAAAGPAAVHGVAAGCEVRTTHRSQESMSHFAKANPNVVSKSDCVFLSSASATGRRGRKNHQEEKEEEGCKKKQKEKDALFPNDESEKDCKPVSQRPSFRNKTLSSPPSSLAASPCFHSSARCTPRCTNNAQAGLVLQPLPPLYP